MNVRLLGPLEVRLGAGPIQLGPRKQRAVLAMLALEVGRTVSVDQLIEGLWDEPPSSAPKMIQLYVSRLRPLLDDGGARIVTHGRGYELQLDDGDVDAVRLEQLLGASRPREALALWSGDTLADVADEPFAAAEIRRIEELRLRASEMAIDADLAAGRPAEVIGELEELVEKHPLRERLHAQRMLALYRAGRQSEALAAYREARAELVDEIGVEPGTELQQLHEAILAHDSSLDLPSTPREEPATAPRRSARRLLVGAAALLLAGVTAFGVIRALEPDALPGIDEDHVGLIDPDSGRITAQYAVGKSPDAVAAGAGSVWIANAADGTVTRVDRDRHQVVEIPVGGAPSALAFGSGSLWVTDGDGRSVAQVDPGRNTVVHPIAVGNAPRAIALAGGRLWVASGVEGGVKGIDLESGRVRTIRIGAIPTALAAGAGALWVTSEESGTVTRINPRSGAVVAPVNVGNGPTAVATGEGAVWVVNHGDGTLSRVDPATNAVSGTVRVGADPRAVAVGGGSVWVAGGEDGTVVRVDPRGPRVLGRLHTGGSPTALTVAGGSVWTAATASASAHRGGTLRVLYSGSGPVPIDWVDKYGDSLATWQLSSLAYDGLVAYPRVGGAAAPTLVGALATRAPAPSLDGRTYVFTLRRGVRYSDGRLVQPEDFRASMERMLVVQPQVFRSYFGRIAGAQACVRPAPRCDLSRGIETDAQARTITVHLTRPDGDFLHKLTVPYAFVVPADTPLRATGDHPPPGTGPYRVAKWDRKRGAGTLVRNPYFRSWSPEARPAGFADRIEFRQKSRPLKAQIAEVQGGRADWVQIADEFKNLLGSKRLAALSARATARLHSDPTPTTEWMFLNVRRRPFDSLRVRQALNLAADRARLVALSGGPETAIATCQMIPTAFPGYEPHCPYTVAQQAGGGWIAPDVERAQTLVRESGRAGERVVVRVPSFRSAVGRYFVGLLDGLGFRASLRVQPLVPYFASVQEPRSRAQIGFVGWAMDQASPSDLLRLNFTCPSGSGPIEPNESRICDPAITRQIKRARTAPMAESAQAWAAVDRRVTDLAAVVAMTNHRSVVLVSRRAGNVQYHLQWSTLLDQMWVR